MVANGLTNLTTQIETAFAEESLASADPAQHARAIASSGGVFGFAELASICRKLEEACASGGDFRKALHHAQNVSIAAVAHARELIIHLEQ